MYLFYINVIAINIIVIVITLLLLNKTVNLLLLLQ